MDLSQSVALLFIILLEFALTVSQIYTLITSERTAMIFVSTES